MKNECATAGHFTAQRDVLYCAYCLVRTVKPGAWVAPGCCSWEPPTQVGCSAWLPLVEAALGFGYLVVPYTTVAALSPLAFNVREPSPSDAGNSYVKGLPEHVCGLPVRRFSSPVAPNDSSTEPPTHATTMCVAPSLPLIDVVLFPATTTVPDDNCETPAGS